jgi:lysophospholipase L1-like esterase
MMISIFQRSALGLIIGLAALPVTPVMGQEQLVNATSPDRSQVGWRFDFGDSHAPAGFIAVTPADAYSEEQGYGFEGGHGLTVDTAAKSSDTATNDSLTSEKAFYFSVKLAPGNYRVTVTSGSPNKASTTTVKAELRRLMAERVQTKAGQFAKSTFVVNVRRPRISDSKEVRLKDRERQKEWRAWDNRLTLEFNDQQPAVAAVEILRIEDLPMLYVIGDSTVCDQPTEDYASWGQMITRFFKPDIVVANHGESGESYRSALHAGRFDKIFNEIKAGDFLIMQFGHNDMKSVDEASYADSIRKVIGECRQRGGIPIVVSPMERLAFDEFGNVLDSHRGFPAAAKSTAEELDVAFIDLHWMSKQLYQAIGPKNAPLAFAQGSGKPDPTHHNNYGSYQLAKCVLEGIRQSVPELATHIDERLPAFDQAMPDDVDTFEFPASPEFVTQTPDGR